MRRLVRYLADAHAIEQQAVLALRVSPALAADERLAAAIRRHEAETRGHRALMAERLVAHGARPSPAKDVVLTAARTGFIGYVRSQPDAPGKLVADSFAYEHLEIAAYELLRRVSELAGDSETSAAASRILAHERRMAAELERGFDAAAEASLRRGGGVHAYLADAHALEMESLVLLEAAVRLTGDGALAAVHRAHRAETSRHRAQVTARLHALEARPSPVKDAALSAAGCFWGLFFGMHPDTAGKLVAFAFAAEHLEVAAYALLARVAARCDDGETAALARCLADEERAAARRLEAVFDRAAAVSAGPR